VHNGKPAVAAALSSDSGLIALIPKARMFDGIARFENAPIYPYLTFEELTNTPALHADDDEIESELSFRIHLWGKASLFIIAGHVNRVMHGIGYGRNYAMDQDEQLDSGDIIKHKIMSFSGIFTTG